MLGGGSKRVNFDFVVFYVWKEDYCVAHFILITVSFCSGAMVRTSAVIYFRSILILMPCNYATLPLVYALKLFAVKGTNNKLQRSLFNFFYLLINRYTAMYSQPKCISLSFKLAQHILDDCFWCCASTPGGQIV